MLESWYEFDTTQLDLAQQQYIELIQKSFCMKTPLGDTVNYELTPYQAEFHASSMNVMMEDANHILWVKARGISFTFSSLIELIMSAASLKNQVIPIISQREKGAQDILNNCKWLISNSRVKEIRDAFIYTEKSTDIINKYTKSKLVAFPSSSAADAIRSYRCIRGLIDEFAFQQRGEELWTAASETMQTDLGQWIVGSTPNGRQNKFFDLVNVVRQKGIKTGFKLFELPVFNPQKFDPKQSIHSQDLKPIAPWVSMKKLEEKRSQSVESFLQENMCDFLDDFTSLVSFSNVNDRVRTKLVNHRDLWLKDLTHKYETHNRIFIGIDVALSGDLFSLTAFEEIKTADKRVFVQRWLDYMNFKEYPDIEEYVNNVIEVFPTAHEVRIDANGLGEALPGYLKPRWGRKIVGVKGSQNIIVDSKKNTVKAKPFMCTNIKRMVESKEVFLLDDPLQVSHLTNVDRTFNVIRSGEKSKGHADIFFAVALALMPSTVRFDGHEEVLAVANVNKDFSSRKKGKEWTEMDPIARAKYYRKQSRR